MRTLKLLLMISSTAAASLTGCGKTEPLNAHPPEKGTIKTAIEGFTGKTTVDIGIKAKEQIKKANEKEMQDRNEAMP